MDDKITSLSKFRKAKEGKENPALADLKARTAAIVRKAIESAAQHGILATEFISVGEYVYQFNVVMLDRSTENGPGTIITQEDLCDVLPEEVYPSDALFAAFIVGCATGLLMSYFCPNSPIEKYLEVSTMLVDVRPDGFMLKEILRLNEDQMWVVQVQVFKPTRLK